MAEKSELEVLAVDDRDVMLKIIQRLCVQIGFAKVDVATNGLHALERLREKRYDLILSDWNMDGMNGFQLLKMVRSLPRTAKTPFILITAEAKPENILAAKAAGANGYLLKPFKLEGFRSTIDNVLAASGLISLERA